MKSKNDCKLVYTIINLAIIFFIIAMDVIHILYKQSHFCPKLAAVSYTITPIFVSILIYIKISIQVKAVVPCSWIIDTICIILFIATFLLFYKTLSLFAFITSYPLTTFIFCLYLWSLIYGLILGSERK